MLEAVQGDSLCHLPTEILLYIFTNLSAKDLIKYRRVCQRWRNIIDGFHKSESIWHDYCKTDFNGVYRIARAKAATFLPWFNIYRALTLWPRLPDADVAIDEFASASNLSEENINFRILANSTIGVHKKNRICYYDLSTLMPTRTPISGNYLRYKENDNAMIILGFQFELYIIRTVLYSSRYKPNVIIRDVKSFLIVEQSVYYVLNSEKIYVVRLDDEDLDPIFLCNCRENILCMGYSNSRLNILTFQRNIYYLHNQTLKFALALSPESKLLSLFKQYNFLDEMDWRVFFNWMYIFNHTVPAGPLKDIIVVRMYGDIVFVGCNWGVLRIYHSPYKNGELDLFNSEPLQQFNFMERSDCPVLSDFCPVIQVDVVETHDGHKVVAAMPKKLVVIMFRHNFKHTMSVAMLPYNKNACKVVN